MIATSAGQLMLNDVLPEDLRDNQRVLDKKGIKALFTEIQQRHPEKYKDILQAYMKLGGDFASTKGISVSLRHTLPGANVKKLVGELKARNQAYIDDPGITDDEREDRIVAETSKAYQGVEDAAVQDHKDSGSPYHLQLISGGRGNASQLNQMSGAELLVADQNNKLIPVPLYSSYADGVPAAEYWGSVYGTRRGVVSTKFATAETGFLGKQIALAAHRQVVTHERPHTSRLPVGLPTDVDDEGNVGAVLARDAGPYKAGTVLSPRILADIKNKDIQDILVHSPLTSVTEDGGLDSWSAGSRDRGELSRIGDNVGVAAAQALSEPITQSALCLAEGTKVLMADGTERPVEAVEVGEFVMGADSSGHVLPVRVLSVFDNGPRECLTYSFRRPASHGDFWHLTCTADHKILGHTHCSGTGGVFDFEKVLPVGKLNKASGAVLPKGYTGPGESYPWAKLLGVLLGDGCYTEAVRGIHLSCADASQIEHLNEYLKPFALEFRLRGGHKIYYGLVDLANRAADRVARDGATGRITGALENHRARQWLRGLGAYGKHAHLKEIPALVWGWDQQSVADLIAGLFVTDGSLYVTSQGSPGISFGSCSQKLATELARLLQFRFGILTTQLFVTKAGSKPSLNHDYYSFTVTRSRDIELFVKAIPLFGVKATVAAAILRATKKTRTDSSWARLACKESVGFQRTWDLEVDHPDHLFVLANGLIVSNSEKHSAGGGKIGKKLGGFAFINKLLQGPEFFQEAAPLAPADGIVQDIQAAPQGGQFVIIGDHKLYVHPGHTVTVKPGQHIEEGDDITDGIPHPADLIKYRGVGEARKVFLGVMTQAFKDSGIKSQRRNLEPVVAGLLNHVQITDPNGAGDHIIDDVVQYNRLASTYVPRDGYETRAPRKAHGMYLEEPALHYSIGTKVTKRVAADLEKWDIKDVQAHRDAPGFQSHWERLMTTTSRDPDWQTRLGGFYIGKSLMDSIHHGAVSDPRSTSYYPAVAQGAGIGQDLATKGTY